MEINESIFVNNSVIVENGRPAFLYIESSKKISLINILISDLSGDYWLVIYDSTDIILNNI